MTNNVLPTHIAEAIVEPKAYGQWDVLQDGFTWARANISLEKNAGAYGSETHCRARFGSVSR